MKGWLKAHPWRALTLAFVLLAAAAALVATGRTPFYTPPYVPETMSTIPSERQTHCLGRYLIDLPEGFGQLSGHWGDIQLYYGLDKNFQRVYATVHPESFTPEQFEARVAQRLQELRETINTETKAPMLLHAERLPGAGAILLRRMSDEDYDSALKSEVHRLVGDRYVEYEQESYDKKSEFGQLNYRNIDPAPAEARLKMIASKLRPQSAGGPGFCFQGVIFDVGQDDEVATFKFRSTTVRDLRLSVHYHAVKGQPSEGLFERDSKYVSDALRAQVTILRQRHREIAGMNAEELLGIAGAREIAQQLFQIETRIDKRSIARSTISVSLRTGAEIYEGTQRIRPEAASTLSDDQLFELWDPMIDSIRLRPGALPAGMTAQGDIPPTCRFGDACPRDGYWMRQVDLPSYAQNAYYATWPMHFAMLKGMVFKPDPLLDTSDTQPHTRWTWMREMDPAGASYAALRG